MELEFLPRFAMSELQMALALAEEWAKRWKAQQYSVLVSEIPSEILPPAMHLLVPRKCYPSPCQLVLTSGHR
jgi:hypothetical protein